MNNRLKEDELDHLHTTQNKSYFKDKIHMKVKSKEGQVLQNKNYFLVNFNRIIQHHKEEFSVLLLTY